MSPELRLQRELLTKQEGRTECVRRGSAAVVAERERARERGSEGGSKCGARGSEAGSRGEGEGA
jgi:hypothetical protein